MMACCDRRASFVLLLGALYSLLFDASAETFTVSASGGGDFDLPGAMMRANPGDTVYLMDGTYDDAIVSRNDGEKDSPITVVGGPDAIINGGVSSRSVLINHSFITLEVGRDRPEVKLGEVVSTFGFKNSHTYINLHR